MAKYHVIKSTENISSPERTRYTRQMRIDSRHSHIHSHWKWNKHIAHDFFIRMSGSVRPEYILIRHLNFLSHIRELWPIVSSAHDVIRPKQTIFLFQTKLKYWLGNKINRIVCGSSIPINNWVCSPMMMMITCEQRNKWIALFFIIHAFCAIIAIQIVFICFFAPSPLLTKSRKYAICSPSKSFIILFFSKTESSKIIICQALHFNAAQQAHCV